MDAVPIKISLQGVTPEELGLAAVSVSKRGTTAVAGRPAIALEARFPAELAKEDHWDVFVDMETARFEEKQHNLEHAVKLYEEVVRTCPGTPQAAEAQERLAQLRSGGK